MDNLVCPVLIHASRHPELIAVETAEKQISYFTLNAMVQAAMGHLRQQGVQPGQIVSTVAGNSIELLILAIACWRSGFIWAPFNPRWLLTDIEQQLRRLRPHWLWPAETNGKCQNNGLYPVLNFLSAQELSERTNFKPPSGSLDPDLTVDLLQTSGTSGNAKFVAHSLRNHLRSAQASAKIIPLCCEDAWLLSLPLHHIAGVAIAFRCFSAGARIVMGNPDANWLESGHWSRVTHVSLVNAQLHDLLAAVPQRLGRLKAVLLGGSAISQQLLIRAKRAGLHCYSSYGMTEASSQIYTIDHGHCGDGQHQPINSTAKTTNAGEIAGQFLKCVEAAVDAQGQIRIRGDSVAAGYWQDGKLLDFRDNQGWFATGDTGQLKDGCLSITGRLDNVFVSNGENLQPERIEQMLASYPAINKALVVAVDGLREGKVPVAFVDWKTVPDKGFTRWLAKKIDGLQRPRALFPWHHVVAKNNKTDRKESTRIAQQLYRMRWPD